MNTTATIEENNDIVQRNPGGLLGEIREQKGYSREYVASKLYLRVRMIELLEADDYQQMPEPVFIKGYLRAYSKLVGTDPEPLLQVYNENFATEKKMEKALWQSRRESHNAQRTVRWFTLLFAVIVLVAVSIWRQKSNENQSLYSANTTQNVLEKDKSHSDISVTDLAKMKSILSSDRELTPLEEKRGG